MPEKSEEKSVSNTESEHLLGKLIGNPEGETLIVFGSVHGNEAGGVSAIRRVLPPLENLREKIRGRVYFLAGNTRALEKSVRFIDADLNRHWTPENITNNLPDSPVLPKVSEDLEQRELLRIFNGIFSNAAGEVYALDLHSTSATGIPFGTVGDTLRNRDFAEKFPITFLLGIEEQLDGTILEYLNNLGAVTLGFEGGQHVSESTVDNHEALIWFALVNSGNLSETDIPEFEKYREILEKATGTRRIVEIRHRQAVAPDDEFEMNAGFENFQPIKRGQLLARDKSGEIKARESGMILMPLYQKLGEDGFFIGREISPFWLTLSRVLRRLRIADFAHFLPGVKKDASAYGNLIIDTNIARFFPLQIFHLLGFRKRRERDHKLIVSRRRFDTKSPFGKKL